MQPDRFVHWRFMRSPNICPTSRTDPPRQSTSTRAVPRQSPTGRTPRHRHRELIHRAITLRNTCAASRIRDVIGVRFPRPNRPEFMRSSSSIRDLPREKHLSLRLEHQRQGRRKRCHPLQLRSRLSLVRVRARLQMAHDLPEKSLYLNDALVHVRHIRSGETVSATLRLSLPGIATPSWASSPCPRGRSPTRRPLR